MGIKLQDYWCMTLKEYLHRVHGYQQEVKIRRSEMRALLYPLYTNTWAALGSKRLPMTPEQYMPIEGENKQEGPMVDEDGLIRKAFNRINKIK